MSGSVSSVEGELNAIVKEFLEYSKLEKTLETFEDECQKLGKPIQDLAGKSRRDQRIQKIKNEFLQHFDDGKRTEFFTEWETHINPERRENDQLCQKLEFYLQIHFAVLPMRKIDHWSKEEVDEAMLHFHYYLESKGSVLSECAELLPYYAMPYVPRPNTHPSFAELFQDAWVTNLRSKLDAFLFEGLKGQDDEEQEPRLIELYHNRDLDLQDARKELQYLERHIEESEKRSVLNAKKCEKLQEECRQLVAVSSLLVTALENAVKGNFVDMDCVLSACTTHLPDLDKLRSESPNLGNNSQVSNLNPAKKPLLSEKLDFNKLKFDIRSSEEKTKALLFQALRWRLTKVSSWNKREESVLEFVNNDLMDFNIKTEETVKIFMFIRSNNNLLLESFTRFLNAFASFVLGRQYLTSNPKLLELLVEHLLTNDPKDDIVLDMILGTLKKLSIRRTSQAYMVEGGVIEWLAGAFHSGAVMSEYARNSSIALLFNLSLCPMGKKRCEPLKVELISGLGRLLQIQDTKISPYVNGILYRILSISSVREYAKEQALPNALRKLMSKTDGEPKKQLETILELFVTDVQIEDGSSDEEDDDQENDSLESEIDSNDNVKCENDEISGEVLLQPYYEGKEEITPEKTASPVHSNRNEDTVSIMNHGCEVRSAISELSVKQSSLLSCSLISEQPLTPKLDVEATQMVRKIVGMPSTTLVEAAVIPDPASVTIKGLNANEYTVAFSSRPKIPRTPEPGEVTSPKIHCNSPLRSTLHREFSSAASKQGIYCNN